MPHETPPRGGSMSVVLWAVLALAAVPIAVGSVVPKDPSPAAEAAAPSGEGNLIVLSRPAPAIDAADNDEQEIRIIRRLDEPISLDVNQMPIRKAVAALAEAAGVAVEIERNTLDLLPYGSKTILTAKIENHPLAESLTEMLRPLALTFRPEKKRILITPTPPLRRIVRRATWAELDLLDQLQTKSWSPELFNNLKLQFHDARAGDFKANRDAILRLAEAVGGGSAADVLERACDQFGSSWYPAGEHIIVLDKTRQIERQLERRLTLRYEQVTLEQALLDLAERAGILLKMEPGALASLSPQVAERFSLTIENATVRQALEVIAGQTGLGYAVESDGVRLSKGSGAAVSMGGGATAAGGDAAAMMRALRSNSFVGQVTFKGEDGKTYAFFIRENDLPPEVNQMRRDKIEDAANEIRRILFAEQDEN